jgi:hypothetical protein
MLGVDAVLGADDRVGHMGTERLLGPRIARLEGVQAHAGDDRGQPPAQVLDAPTVRPADSQPGLLNRVLRVGQRAEHPIGDRSQMGTVLLEALGQELVLVHQSHSLVAPCHRDRQTKSIGCDSQREAPPPSAQSTEAHCRRPVWQR